MKAKKTTTTTEAIDWDSSLIETQVDVLVLQDALRGVVTPWEPDSSVPCNYVRKDGMGKVVAQVDRWCGGFQDPHKPATIGWKSQVGNTSQTGVLAQSLADRLQRDPEKKAALQGVLKAARNAADAALAVLGPKLRLL